MSLSAESPQSVPPVPGAQPLEPLEPLEPAGPEPGPFDAVDRFTIRSTEDLIAMTPVVLGFAPADSIVVLTFGSGQPFHARLDLPAADADRLDDQLDQQLGEAADLVLAPARRHGADLVALLVYTDDPALADRAAAQFARRLDPRARPQLVAAVRVTPLRWFRLLADARTSPEVLEGEPYDLTGHPLVAQAVLAGRVTLGSRAELAATLDPDPEACDRIARLLAGRAAPSPRRRQLDVMSLLAEGTWVERTVTEHARAGTVPDDADVVRLVIDVGVGPLRDAAWSWVTRPVARDHVELWRSVVRRCPDAVVAHPAAVLAWAAYQDGAGALAWCAVERSLAADPRAPLARLVGDLLTAAVPPDRAGLGMDWRETVLPRSLGRLTSTRGRGAGRR